MVKDGLSDSRIGTSLRRLNISNLKLHREEQWTDLVKWISSDEPVALEFLDLSETGIPGDVLSQILTSISPQIGSVAIRARRNNLGQKGGAQLGQVAAKITKVHELDLGK